MKTSTTYLLHGFVAPVFRASTRKIVLYMKCSVPKNKNIYREHMRLVRYLRRPNAAKSIY